MSVCDRNNVLARRDLLIAVPVCLCVCYIVVTFALAPDWRMVFPGIALLLLLLGPVVLYKAWAMWVLAIFYLGLVANTIIEYSLSGSLTTHAVTGLAVWGVLIAALLVRRLCSWRSD